MRNPLLTTILTVAVSTAAASPGPTVSGPIDGTARVIDGDTIAISPLYSEDEEVRIRIWGLDSPDLHASAGRADKETMQRIIGANAVQCMPTGDRSYNRLVARCTVGGRDLAEAMIQEGNATPYCRFAGTYYDQAARRAGKETCAQ